MCIRDSTYGGDCSSSDNTTTVANDNRTTITFNALNDGTYSDCTVTVTDSAGNASTALDVTSFTVAVPPVLAEVTPVPTPTSDSTPDYTFSSTEAGTITYGGACGSDNRSASSGNNTVTLTQPDNSTPLSDGTYDNCTIAVTDNNSNTSDNLSVRGINIFGNITDNFTIAAVKPILLQVTPVPTLDNDSTPNYTFFSTLSGTINIGGSCRNNSDNNTALADNNTVTFRKHSGGGLDDATYTSDNCTISVTSSDNVTSDNLPVNSFTIDTTAPLLTPVTPVPTLGNVRTPNYTFHSNEAGDITYGCLLYTSDAADE